MDCEARSDPDPFATVWPRLRRAHARLEQALPYSPDWACAIAELEGLAREIRCQEVTRVEVPFKIARPTPPLGR